MLEFRLETLHGRNYNTTGRAARPIARGTSGRYFQTCMCPSAWRHHADGTVDYE